MKEGKLKSLEIFGYGCLLLALISGNAYSEQRPLVRAHAHNDYLHSRPLLDALDQGFCSVEADIYLIDGNLLVAHDRDKVQPDKTLASLYLQPLAQRVRSHGGQVFSNKAPFMLLIDIKSEAEATYARLREELKTFSDMLTVFTPRDIKTNAVTIVLSGNRPSETVAAERERYVAIDGRLPDLETNSTPSVLPLISDNWTKHFEWKGQGPIGAAERGKLRGLVKQAHDQGRRIRFWAVADREEAWAELYGAGVDLINTDDLTGLAGFLRTK